MTSAPRRPNAPRASSPRLRLARTLGPLLIVVVITLLYGVYMQTRLAGDDATAREKWSTLESALNERSQLALRFVDVVRDRAPQTRAPNGDRGDDPESLDAILDDVERAATRLDQPGAPTDRADANVALGDELGRLLGAVRDMTALRDDDEYRKALDALANATTAVSNARGEYNEVVLKENKIVDGFPGKLIAPLFKLEPREYFNARVVEDEAQNSGGAAAPYSSGVTTSVEPLPPADGK